MKRSVALAPLLLCALLSACVTVGRQFEPPQPGAVRVRETTEAEVREQYGEPYSTSQFMKNGRMISTLHYYYGEQEAGNVVYKKHLVFFFSDHRCAGYVFSTGFPKEQQYFAPDDVPKIVKGKTTKAEVFATFGPPQSDVVFPMTEEDKTVEGDSAIGYAYHRQALSVRAWIDQILIVTFDQNGVVKLVEFHSDQKSAEQNQYSGPTTGVD
jgi:hypothetical protein